MEKEIRNRKITLTADGSHTLFLPDWNEHYHSVNGAIRESKHVFIKKGLAQLNISTREIHVLEVGFGTGLNALLSLEYAQKKSLDINYLGLEPYPLSQSEAMQLNYASLVAKGIYNEAFLRMHELPFGKTVSLARGFLFSKWQIELDLAPLASSSFHVVFHDAFAPQYQPELWDEEAFSRLYAVLKPGGVLVTYSAKGSVKRALTACGFALKHPVGPPGKREMTFALK